MSRMAIDRLIAPLAATTWLLLGVGAGGVAAQETPAPATDAPAASELVGTSISLSRDEAELILELTGGRQVTFALSDGGIYARGRKVGSYHSGDALDESWRDLLRGVRGTPAEMARRLSDWVAPGGDEGGAALDTALEAALTGAPAADAEAEGAQAPAADAAAAGDSEAGAAVAPVAPQTPNVDDTVGRLNERIQELERTLSRARSHTYEVQVNPWERRGGFHPFMHIGRGISDLLSTLAIYVVLLILGFATVFFGRKYLEGVADTARHQTLRSGLVGFAATFLVFPAFIVGMLVLAISIVGIPALIVWIPLFPVAVVVALLFGYLAVAHAAGEALAERRFYGGDWFKRANSYYYIFTGVGLLLALFLAGDILEMAGPLLGFIRGLLVFLGVTLTWAAFTVGLGAVLLSRAGTRLPAGVAAASAADSEFAEETRV